MSGAVPETVSGAVTVSGTLLEMVSGTLVETVSGTLVETLSDGVRDAIQRSLNDGRLLMGDYGHDGVFVAGHGVLMMATPVVAVMLVEISTYWGEFGVGSMDIFNSPHKHKTRRKNT